MAINNLLLKNWEFSISNDVARKKTLALNNGVSAGINFVAVASQLCEHNGKQHKCMRERERDDEKYLPANEKKKAK